MIALRRIWPAWPSAQMCPRSMAMRGDADAPHLALPPLPDSPDRPLWSVMIPTYNCADFLRETLESVMAQAPEPGRMQIEVIDDHSTEDDPEAIVRDVGAGRVGFYRQPKNVGHVRNFETSLIRARGHLVHLLHGDDVVLPGFYRAMERAFDTQPEIGAAFCRHVLMDEQGRWNVITWLEQDQDGILENWFDRIVVEQRIQAPSIVVRRAVYEQLGGFDRRLACCGEDWEMWVRIATRYPVWYVTELLAAYRVRAGSLSRNATLTAADTTDLHRATCIVASYLARYISEPRAGRLIRAARTTVALAALRTARRLEQGGHRRGAAAQLRAALACSTAPGVIASAAPVAYRLALHALTGAVPRRDPWQAPWSGRRRATPARAEGISR